MDNQLQDYPEENLIHCNEGSINPSDIGFLTKKTTTNVQKKPTHFHSQSIQDTLAVPNLKFNSNNNNEPNTQGILLASSNYSHMDGDSVVIHDQSKSEKSRKKVEKAYSTGLAIKESNSKYITNICEQAFYTVDDIFWEYCNINNKYIKDDEQHCRDIQQALLQVYNISDYSSNEYSKNLNTIISETDNIKRTIESLKKEHLELIEQIEINTNEIKKIEEELLIKEDLKDEVFIIELCSTITCLASLSLTKDPALEEFFMNLYEILTRKSQGSFDWKEFKLEYLGRKSYVNMLERLDELTVESMTQRDYFLCRNIGLKEDLKHYLLNKANEEPKIYLNKIIKWCTIMADMYDMTNRLINLDKKNKKLSEDAKSKKLNLINKTTLLALNEEMTKSCTTQLDLVQNIKEETTDIIKNIENDMNKCIRSFSKMKNIAKKINKTYLNIDPDIYNTSPLLTKSYILQMQKEQNNADGYYQMYHINNQDQNRQSNGSGGSGSGIAGGGSGGTVENNMNNNENEQKYNDIGGNISNGGKSLPQTMREDSNEQKSRNYIDIVNQDLQLS